MPSAPAGDAPLQPIRGESQSTTVHADAHAAVAPKKQKRGGESWRSDGRCGPEFKNSFGWAGECDPEGANPCCNARTGWCGQSEQHCTCSDVCTNYSTGPLFDPSRFEVSTEPAEAVVVLARMRSSKDLRQVARLLVGLRSCTWLASRGAPVLVLYDGEVHPACATGKLFASASCASVFGSWGDFVRFVNVTQYFIAPPSYRGASGIRGYPLSYAIMCEFWSARIFQVPETRKLRYYLRLDADATISCGDEATDAFAAMKATGAHYGYYLYGHDEEDVSIGFTNHLQDYMLLLNAAWAEAHPPSGTDIFRAPMFYNNFEVVDVAFFQQDAVQRYTRAVLDSEGIYLHRWGDAIVRYGQLKVGQGRAICFQATYAYCHGLCCTRGKCEWPAGGCKAGSIDANGIEFLAGPVK
eukprot:gnl/TRDRNA2_/TRDRNA2_30803_c0_seq1.p1 gnl/TRDRNA2_/TRDRNA2_30803_c0~~gnl/TRDRNA2_/TRDRNA2_30803_c0_seq1.p1  ORF type:complete len:452 (+),score=74.86 gnl/TRDRNA2_/TRDRNA2_30803_c0_seq1:126-1358(+)